jgi:hypothetical protein
MDLEAQSFVADPGCDQRREMYHWLCETVGEQGSIIVFSKNFETAMIRQLSRTAEDEAGADALVKRIVDLLDPFAEFWVYHPEQRGKVSLKRLLPVYTRTGHRGTHAVRLPSNHRRNPALLCRRHGGDALPGRGASRAPERCGRRRSIRINLSEAT